MRVLLVLLLAGFSLVAATPLYDHDQVGDFEAFADDVNYFAEESQDDLVQKLKDRFQEVVKKVKDAIDQGKGLKDGLETLEKIRQKLKEYNIDLGDFGSDYLQQLKDKVKDYWQKLKDRLGVSKRNADIDVDGMIEEFKRMINEKFDPERIKAFVKKYFGENKEVVEALTKFIRENSKESFNKISDFFKKLFYLLLGARHSRNSDVLEEIRDFFKDFGIDIKNRFTKFGERIKEQYQNGLEKTKNRLENFKIIAEEFSRKISENVAEEALEFFKKNRNHLDDIFDEIELKVKDILRQD